MTADNDHDGKTERARQRREVKVISSGILATVGGIAAIAAIIVFVQSGKSNLILSAIFSLMLIIGIAFLLFLKKRRSALMGAAAMLVILILAAGAIFFARMPGEDGSFANPSNGQHVRGKSLVIAGNVEGISSDLTLLCIVKDDSGNYFPHLTQSAEGRWSAVVGLGPQRINRPLPFTLALATATQSAVDEFRTRAQADPGYNNHGLGLHLPPGIETLAKVEIVRTS